MKRKNNVISLRPPTLRRIPDWAYKYFALGTAAQHEIDLHRDRLPPSTLAVLLRVASDLLCSIPEDTLRQIVDPKTKREGK